MNGRDSTSSAVLPASARPGPVFPACMHLPTAIDPRKNGPSNVLPRIRRTVEVNRLLFGDLKLATDGYDKVKTQALAVAPASSTAETFFQGVSTRNRQCRKRVLAVAIRSSRRGPSILEFQTSIEAGKKAKNVCEVSAQRLLVNYRVDEDPDHPWTLAGHTEGTDYSQAPHMGKNLGQKFRFWKVEVSFIFRFSLSFIFLASTK
ncbi:hypothetical protein C8R43DRAFT_1113649, partial [Mycena crocata]